MRQEKDVENKCWAYVSDYCFTMRCDVARWVYLLHTQCTSRQTAQNDPYYVVWKDEEIYLLGFLLSSLSHSQYFHCRELTLDHLQAVSSCPFAC